jgi:hypothetical protein
MIKPTTATIISGRYLLRKSSLDGFKILLFTFKVYLLSRQILTSTTMLSYPHRLLFSQIVVINPIFKSPYFKSPYVYINNVVYFVGAMKGMDF